MLTMTDQQRAVLEHVLSDADAWLANAIDALGEDDAAEALTAKVAAHGEAYYSALLSDPEGYLPRAARDAAQPGTLDEARLAKVVAVNRQRDVVLLSGAPYADRHIAVDDGARADMGGMATHANTVLMTAGGPSPIAWPDSYALGWIAIDNTRVPLPAPVDGLILASTVGAWYGAVVQRARDLKDAVLAAEDIGTLNAIDITAGWPG